MSEVRKRVPAGETRSLLVEAALARMESNGVAVNLDSVSLEEMVGHAGVPRSSAYAAWQQLATEGQTPQAAFRREVLRQALIGGGEGARDNRPMIEAVVPVLERRNEFDIAVLAVEMMRVATAAQFDDARNRQGYRTSHALAAASVSVPDDQIDAEILGWLRDAERAYVDTMVVSFQQFAEMTEVVPAPDLDGPLFWRQFTTAVLALGEGLFTRVYTADRDILFGLDAGALDGVEHPDDDGWTLFGVAMHALYNRFFVPASDQDGC